MVICQISVFIENKPGRLYEVVKTIADGGIDIRALSLADTTDFGILRLIVSDTAKAMELLRENSITATQTNVIGVKLGDTPGELANILEILKTAEVAVEYSYAFLTHTNNEACVVLRVEDNDAAGRALIDAGVTLVSEIM